MVQKVIWIFLILIILSTLSIFIFKKSDRTIDFFNEIVVEKKIYSIKDLVKDSPNILYKIQELVHSIGLIKFFIFLFTCLFLRVVYVIILVFWIILTYFRLKEYEKNEDIGSFCIKEKEFEFKEYRSITNLFFVFIPKCSSFCIVYIINYNKKYKIFISEKFFKKFLNTLLLIFILGTSTWNLFMFIDLVDNIKNLEKDFKNENIFYKFKILKKDIKELMILKYSSSIRVASELRIYKNDDGLNFNSNRVTSTIFKSDENCSIKASTIIKILSKDDNNKKLKHPALSDEYWDDVNEDMQATNALQLTSSPIKHSKFFELFNVNNRNYVMYNIIQNIRNTELYGNKSNVILEYNGLTSFKKIEAVRRISIIKQLKEKNTPRIYELPDKTKIIIKDDNSFIEGVILDQTKDDIIKNKMMLPKRKIMQYKEWIDNLRNLNEEELNALNEISSKNFLNMHENIDENENEKIEWFFNKKFE